MIAPHASGRHLCATDGEKLITFARSLDGDLLAKAKQAISDVLAQPMPDGRALIEVRGLHLYLEASTWLAQCCSDDVAQHASKGLRAVRVMDGRYRIFAGHQRLGEAFGRDRTWLAEPASKRDTTIHRARSLLDAALALWRAA